jgi:hypothetical protein
MTCDAGSMSSEDGQILLTNWEVLCSSRETAGESDAVGLHIWTTPRTHSFLRGHQSLKPERTLYYVRVTPTARAMRNLQVHDVKSRRFLRGTNWVLTSR